jgi:hypothetical protein
VQRACVHEPRPGTLQARGGSAHVGSSAAMVWLMGVSSFSTSYGTGPGLSDVPEA